MGERLLCTEEVRSSSLLGSTKREHGPAEVEAFKQTGRSLE